MSSENVTGMVGGCGYAGAYKSTHLFYDNIELCFLWVHSCTTDKREIFHSSQLSYIKRQSQPYDEAEWWRQLQEVVCGPDLQDSIASHIASSLWMICRGRKLKCHHSVLMPVCWRPWSKVWPVPWLHTGYYPYPYYWVSCLLPGSFLVMLMFAENHVSWKHGADGELLNYSIPIWPCLARKNYSMERCWSCSFVMQSYFDMWFYCRSMLQMSFPLLFSSDIVMLLIPPPFFPSVDFFSPFFSFSLLLVLFSNPWYT